MSFQAISTLTDGNYKTVILSDGVTYVVKEYSEDELIQETPCTSLSHATLVVTTGWAAEYDFGDGSSAYRSIKNNVKVA